VCRQGASWVQQNVLGRNPDPDLRVYVVWFDMLFGDSRDRWDGDGMTDPRVVHFWDEHKTVGNWFSANLTHNPGTTWDFYALYGPDATSLASPVSSGGTIIGRSGALRTSIEPLLRASSPS
jgi:hypothetical protein